MSRLLLSQQQKGEGEEYQGDDRDRDDVSPEIGHAECLREHADSDRLIPGGRECQAEILAPPDKDDTGANSPEKFTAGTMERIAVANTAAT